MYRKSDKGEQLVKPPKYIREAFMKCQKLKSTAIRNSFFALCLLLGAAVATPTYTAPTKDFDKVLNKEDLDTIILEIRKEIAASNPEALEHFDKISGLMFEARNNFFDPKNNEHLSVHAQRMEVNYALWHNEIVHNPAYACVKDKTAKLYAKLIAMLIILKKHTSASSSFIGIIPLGLALRSYEHLLPKKLNKNLTDLLQKRLKKS